MIIVCIVIEKIPKSMLTQANYYTSAIQRTNIHQIYLCTIFSTERFFSSEGCLQLYSQVAYLIAPTKNTEPVLPFTNTCTKTTATSSAVASSQKVQGPRAALLELEPCSQRSRPSYLTLQHCISGTSSVRLGKSNKAIL